MIKVGDTVKVTGKTTIFEDGEVVEKELIPTGTVCKVIETHKDKKNGLLVDIVPESELSYKVYEEFWYAEKDVQKVNKK